MRPSIDCQQICDGMSRAHGLSVQLGSSDTDPETYTVIGAAMEVHRILGCGFLESVYRAALVAELQLRDVPTAAEVPFKVFYRTRELPVLFRADLVCFESIVVEVKSKVGLGGIDVAQAINYLKVSTLRKALLLNFGTLSLQHRRVVL